MVFGVKDYYPSELSLQKSFVVRLQNIISSLISKGLIINAFKYLGAYNSPSQLSHVFFHDVPINFTLFFGVEGLHRPIPLAPNARMVFPEFKQQ